MSNPIRHHYVPIFYLKPWATGPNRLLCEYSRPYQQTRARRKHPAATGYKDGLYTVPGLPADDAQFVERKFMQANDDWAAKAHAVFLKGQANKEDIDAKQLVAWVRFIYSLMVRNPENIAKLKRKAIELHMSTPAEALLPDLINSRRVIEEITKMGFHTMNVRDTKHSFLTSDRPIIMTNGIIVENAHIVIPITPTRFFIAAKSRAIVEHIATMSADELVHTVNDKVAQQARQFVYGVDDTQLRFVSNRLGKRVPSTPLG